MYHKFGYTSIDQAKMFLTTGVVMAVLQGSVVRRLPNRQTKRSAVFGLYLIVPAFILVGLASDGKLLYAGMILFAICKWIASAMWKSKKNWNQNFFLRQTLATAFVVTCMTTLVSEYGRSDQKGTVLGIYRSLGALARALGPIAASIGRCISFDFFNNDKQNENFCETSILELRFVDHIHSGWFVPSMSGCYASKTAASTTMKWSRSH